MLAQLCADLARDFDVTVVTGTLPNARAGRERRDGVDVIRVRSTTFARRRLSLRALNYATFLAQSLRTGLRQERPGRRPRHDRSPRDRRRRGCSSRTASASPLVVSSQDVFPETAERLGRIQNGLVLRLLRTLVRLRTFAARTAIVAIGETMRERLVAKGARARTTSS